MDRLAFTPSLGTMGVARGAATAAVWNSVRDVIGWLDSPTIRDLPACEAADLLAQAMLDETGEPGRG